MADYRAIVGLADPARGSSILGRTEPDLHLIKRGGTGDNSAFGKTGLALRGDSERGNHRRGRRPRISDFAITALAVIWLQKQPGAAEGDLSAKRQSGKATDPTRRFHRTRSAKFAETDT